MVLQLKNQNVKDLIYKKKNIYIYIFCDKTQKLMIYKPQQLDL